MKKCRLVGKKEAGSPCAWLGKRVALVALTLCLAFSTQGVFAGTVRSAGCLKLYHSQKTLELTNVVNGAVRLTDADLPSSSVDWMIDVDYYGNPQGTSEGYQIEYIQFDTHRPGMEWGSDDIKIDYINLTLSSNITIKAAANVGKLVAVGTNSMFTFKQNAGKGHNLHTFTNLVCQGAAQSTTDFAPYDGGAINLNGGWFNILDCQFSDFRSRFTGGAVSARNQTQNSKFYLCTFKNNSAHPINGYGGAVYVTAVRSLSIRDSTGYVLVEGCTFEGNSAENGGAICTLPVIEDSEKGLPVRAYWDTVEASHTRTTFKNNNAVYQGGAILSGAAVVTRTNTYFIANSAGLAGGAICVTGIDGEFVTNATTYIAGCFNDNIVTDDVEWTVGGALAVLPPNCNVVIDNYAAFTNNSAWATASGQQALGGAVYIGDGCTTKVERVSFEGNYTRAGSDWCYGDAISVSSGKLTVDTCVFNCTNANDKSFGNAIDCNETVASVKNSTFRHGKVEAISAYKGSLAVTNCVIVGNGASGDLYLEGAIPVTMAYSAYGKMQLDRQNGATLAEIYNLSNRVASQIYEGESLRLRGKGFNEVAGLGLVQSASDFVNVTYGSKSLGYSMGAYETPTAKMTVEVYGEKKYDTTTSSNGCAFTWSSYTNASDKVLESYDWPEDNFGPISEAYLITNWVYGSANVGYYASTNNTLSAGVTSRTDRVEWLGSLVNVIYTGTIATNDSEVFVVIVPDEYVWTGSAVTPGKSPTGGSVVVSNLAANVEVPSDWYKVEYVENVNPSDAAKIVVTGTNNYNFVQTNTFFITAYLTQFYTDDVLTATSTNGMLSASNAVAVISVPAGYCLDYQNSVTNKTVYKYGTSTEAADPDITTLKVLYALDSNDDKVPDKYQKKIIMATVNGGWSSTTNAYDQTRLVTMTNGVYTKADGTTEGVWSTDSAAVCAVTESMFPAAGARPNETFTEGAWKQIYGSDTASWVIKWAGPQIFLYEYAHDDSPARDESGDKRTLNALLAAKSNDASSGYEAALKITGFEMDPETGAVAGSVIAQVLKDGQALVSAELDNSKLVVLGCTELGGEWFEVGSVTTDADGVWTLTRTRSTRSFTATRTFNSDRTTTVNVSDSGQPKFFKVQLVEE